MPTNAEKAATARYKAAHIKRVNIALNDRTDTDILKHLESIDNVQGYIKSLIRSDIMKKEQTK